jgi:hypothetical protein
MFSVAAILNVSGRGVADQQRYYWLSPLRQTAQKSIRSAGLWNFRLGFSSMDIMIINSLVSHRSGPGNTGRDKTDSGTGLPKKLGRAAGLHIAKTTQTSKHVYHITIRPGMGLEHQIIRCFCA